MFKRLFVFIGLLVVSLGPSQAAQRLGLVIGNDSYTHVAKLEKARSDAEAITESLTAVGFDVTRVLDADRREMNRAISTFVAKLQPGDTALVYYAGHGVEIDGQNYLLPTNIESPDNANEDFIKSESIELSSLLSRVQSTGARITLMFIDACRDNPFAGAAGRSIGGTRGLARITAPEGTFVVFSAGARQQALDRLNGEDDDPNSVFTRSLLPKLKDPDLELRQLVSRVRLEVRDLALKQNHQQFPAYYDELLGKFYFSREGGETATETQVSAEPAPASGGNEELRADFESVRSLNSIVAYEAFLDKHKGKSDLLIDIARRRLELLQNEVAKVEPAPRVAEPEEKPVEKEIEQPAVDNRREIIRLSQQRLNALGCSVGTADGVSGPRTRQAFRDYITNSGADLRVADLGSQNALDRLTAAKGTICKKVVAKPAPVEKPRQAEVAEPIELKPAVVEVEPAKPIYPASLAGSWSLRAKCPLAIRAVGTIVYSSLGGNRYASVTRDNFGNLGKGFVTDQGNGLLAVDITWQDGAKDIYTAKLSNDRRTITGKNYAGCRFTARKQD